MNRKQKLYLGLILVMAMLLCGFSCSTGTQKLAIASDAISHALVNADTAASQALTAGVISSDEQQAFHGQLVKVAQAGLVLNQGIRANESATTISTKVNSFLDAFNTLNTSGVAGIKDPKTQLAISTILTSAETSIAIITATVGGK